MSKAVEKKTDIKEELKKLPNQITALRFVLYPLLVYFMVTRNKVPFAVVLVTMGLSDIVDGIVARKLNMCSNFGSNLDSYADDLTFFSALPVLYFLAPDALFHNLYLVGLLFVLLTTSRVVGIIKFRNRFRLHTYLGKGVATAIYPVLLLMIFSEHYFPFFLAYVIFTAVELTEEILIFLTYKHIDNNVKSLFFRRLNSGKKWIKD